MTSPRPILKRAALPSHDIANPLLFASCQTAISPHVHFPPTPCMSSTHPVYSPQTYDRAPIAISPNACQLPSRGSRKLQSSPVHFEIERRGRSRIRTPSSSSSEEDVKGSYFHPRAYEACKLESSNGPATVFEIPSQPILVADLSPSDESDDSIVTSPDHDISPMTASPTHSHFLHSPHRQLSRNSNEALVLPHGVTEKHRPHLHGNARRPDKEMKALPTGLDEGCLGGF